MRRLILMGTSSLLVVLLTTSCNPDVNFSSATKKSYDAESEQIYSFAASKIENSSVTIKDGGRYTSFDLTQGEKPKSQFIQQQIKRKPYSDLFTQGHLAKFTKDEFQLSEAGFLDLLVVVDNSKSMVEEQTIIGRGLAPLISDIKDSNWQIAVISMSDPCVSTSNLIKKTDADPAAKFAAAVKKPYDYRALEQGFPMAIQALQGKCNGAIKSWLRPGSSVGVLFLSDEDNCGSDPGEQDRCRNLPGKNATEMISFLRSIRSAEESRMYAIVDKDGTCPDAGGVGPMYVQAATGTGGSVASICHDFDNVNGYGAYLKSVSTDVKRILKRKFMLSAVPDMGRFDVEVDGLPIDSTGVVSVKGNLVTIDPTAFGAGLKISFGYTHDAVPMFSEVALTAVPAPSTLKVTVNGLPLVEGSDFTYDVTKKTLVFKSQPPEDAKISVTYLEDLKLLTHFGVDLNGVRHDTLSVTINGISVPAGDYSYDSTGIEFASPPADASIVSVAWKTEDHKILRYPASISDARHPVAYIARDKATGSEIAADWDHKVVTFTPDNVIEGRVVTVEIDFGGKSAVRTIDLPNERIDDIVSIKADGKDGVCKVIETQGNGSDPKPEQGNNWRARFKGNSVTFQCQDGIDYSELAVEFKYEAVRVNKFVVKLPPGTDPNDQTLGWQVFIDGKVTKEFTRDGAEIHIEDDLLPPEARVDVKVITYTRYEK